MAELVLSAFLGVLFEKLASAAWKSIATYKGIDADIKKWHRSLKQINDVLLDASRKEITNQSVKRWLDDLQHLAYDIDDILDDFAIEAMDRELNCDSEAITSKVRKIIPSCCTNFSKTTTMHDKLNVISTKLQDLVNEKTDLGLRVEEETRPTNNKNNHIRKYQSSVVDPSSIVGRQSEKEALVQQLLSVEPSDKTYSIVPIFGMGGIGKTTLAKLLYEEEQVNDHFQIKAWVCVSDEFDSYGISKIIFQSVAGVNKEFADLNLLQVDLVKHLRGKRFMLVLDDIWTESYGEWETLAGPFHVCAPGSKIIITTRKEQLLRKLGCEHLNKQLHRLSDEDALFLIARHALGVNNFDPHLSLKPHAEGIVKKCGGVPLALISLGRLLRTKGDEEENWKDILNNEIWRLRDGGGILPALRVSFHDLSAPLKRVFAYCSLFPKDFLFDIEELVLLWMAEGLLHQPTLSILTKENLGREYFDELLSRSFFEHAPNDQSLFVMHDLINDLAMSVASEFFVRLDTENEKNIRNEMLEKYRHMSFVCDEYVAHKNFEAFKSAKSLRTLLATHVGVVDTWQKSYLGHGWKKWSTNSTGVVFPCVKHLLINDCPNLVEVTLASLPSLNVLEINGCHNLVEVMIEALPSLNVLEITECDSGVLRRLIQVAFAITKLSIGDISGLSDVVWRGVIEHIGAVKELWIWNCNELSYLWESDAAASKALTKLRELRVGACEKLVRLGEKEEEGYCRSNLLTSLRLLEGHRCENLVDCSFADSIELLTVSSCTSITALPTVGQKLKSFYINGCNKLMERELGGKNLSKILEYVHIKDWANLKSVIELNHLVHLTDMRIEDCESLESFPCNELSKLTVLKNLEIINCPSMDACFPGGVWPPNLCSLKIGKLKKPIS